MKKLSTGHDSTLKTWRRIALDVFGEDSPAIAFLDEKVKAEGENAWVLDEEAHICTVLVREHVKVFDKESGNRSE